MSERGPDSDRDVREIVHLPLHENVGLNRDWLYALAYKLDGEQPE